MSFTVLTGPDTSSDAKSSIPPNAGAQGDWVWALGHCKVRVSAPSSVSFTKSEAVAGEAASSSAAVSSQRSRALVIVDGYFADSVEISQAHETDTPAEKIADLIQRRGWQAVEKLTGSFVVIIIDPDSGNARVWRDRLGGRTAYWRCSDRTFFVSSSVSAIAAQMPDVAEDKYWLSQFFALRSPSSAGLTAFAGIQEVLPGEWVAFTNGEIRRTRKPFPCNNLAAERSEKEWVDRFASAFTHSVRTVLPPTGDAAVMLSGGLDSGPAAWIASAELARTGRKLNVVSWALSKDKRADESEFIQVLCRELQQPLDLFDGTALEPFGDLRTEMVPADFPQFNGFRRLILECYRRAREAGVGVILNAAAGDQIYPLWKAGLLDLWRRRQWRAFAVAISRLARHQGVMSLFADPYVRHWIGQTMPCTRRIAGRNPVPAWLTPEAVSCLPPAEPWPPEAMRHHLPQYALQLIGQSMAQGMAHENAFSRRYGLDRRDPFHNEELVRLMLEMPVRMSHRGSTEKWVMRQAMQGKLPEQLRTKKRTGLLNSFYAKGFSQNVREIEDLLFSQQTDWQAWVRPDFVRAVLNSDSRSDKEMLAVNQCVGHALWRQRIEEEGISIR